MENTIVIKRNTEPKLEDYLRFFPNPCEDEKFMSEQLEKATQAKQILFGIFQDTVGSADANRYNCPQWTAYEAAKALETKIRGQWAVFYRQREAEAIAAYLKEVA
jgi:hypothetical protein